MKNILIIALCTLFFISNAQSTNSNEMYNLLVKFTVKSESISEFREACIHSVIESRKEAGNIEMRMYADKNIDNVFYVSSRWDNKEAYEYHKQLPHSNNIAKVGKASLMNAPEIMFLGLTNPPTVRGMKQVNPQDEVETLFFIFKIKDGYRDQVIKRFESHVAHSRKEEGNLSFEFYTIDGNPNSFVVYENWRSHTALMDIHLKKPYSEETGALLGKAMIGEMEQYMNFITELVPHSVEPISKIWEMDGFEMPESVVADPNSDWIYVSNIVNQDTPGYISRVSKSGKVDNYKWLEGINQPCGLGIYNNILYVGDQDKVHIIDIKKSKVIKSLSAEGALTFNDVAIAADGQVFISDVMSGSIYTIVNNKLELWIKNQDFTNPNGLYVDNGDLIVADLGNIINPGDSPVVAGSVYRVNISNKKVQLIKPSYHLGGLDGVVKVGNQYVVTNNGKGELYSISDKERTLLATFTSGIADLGAEGQTVYIPNFKGTVTSYILK